MRSISLVLIALFISAVGLNATIITVNWDGTGDFITIQEGINASSNGDTVLVYPGTYQETINYNGKSITVGSLFIITADSTYIEVTEISSTIFSYTVRFENCEDSTSIIKGLTLGINNSSHGIYCNNSSPIISDNIISTPNGCGIRCDSLSIPIIDNNIITHASRGIHLLYNSSPRIINNYFYENGTGIFIYNSSPLIEGNTISESGRAIQINGVSNPNIFNNYIINNHYGLQVSPDNQIEKIYINNNLITNCCIGIQCNSSHISIINNSILYNSYCGIYSSYQPEIINCIIWGNGSSFNLDASPTISHSCFEGEFPINGIDNGGNISRNPCFINTLSENYHLQMASPCMEAGTIDTTGLNLLEFDLDGNLRIQDGNGDGISIIDMGCYESDTVTNPGYIEGTVYLIGGDGDVEQTQIFIGTPVNTDSNGHYQITIGEGTYNITAYLHKYIPQTIEGISVIVGEITYGIDSYLDYYGNIITVNHDGTGNYLTIQEGINCAENGDTVLVYPGTYIENINYNGKSILVGSLFFTTQDITYISQTVIDGNQNGHCVEFINQEDSTAILIGFTISNGGFDTLLGSGGGIYCCNSSPIITNSIISNNITADYGFGGGIYCENSNISLSSVTLFENTAYFGGGIFFYNSNPSLSQVTIKKNTASYGGGISSEDYSNLNFDPVNRCNIFLNYAISGYDLYFTGDSTINVIVDTFTVLMPDEYYAYPIDSFTFDILNFKIEQVDQDLYVSPSGSDDNSGLTIESPLQTISWALAIINSDSTNPHTIHLASGTYSQSNTGERFPLNCRSYISLQGEGEDLTVLDGEGLSGILECINDSCFSIENMTLKSGNAHHGGGIHFCNSSPTLENIILNGNISDYGGGIYCFDSSPTLENIILSGNIADDYGGGIYCNNSDLSLSNVTLLENTANSGGGIYCDGSFLSIENATISENISSSSGGGIGCTGSAMVLTNITISRNISSGGGGIYCKNSSQNLTNVTINGNTASSFGGGIYYSYSSPSLTNVIITGNNASMGAGIFCSRGSSDLRNVTITNNTADNRGGGIMGIQSSQNLLNCIVWNNVPYEIYGIIDTITVNYSDIKNGWEGIGNINTDPLFANPENEDFHLTGNSPCIDTGIPDTTDLNLPFWDLDFKHRIWDGNDDGIAIIDMGCYEYGAGPLKIYPGDTNNDGIVDTLDILPIGQYFRKTGGLRETASLEWEPQVLPTNWANINYAYSDCNGDGEVNIADVHAICLNWGKTHEDTGFIITFTTEELQNNIDTFQQIYDNLEGIGIEMVIKNYLANVFGFPSIPGNIIYLSQNYPNPFSTTTTISFYLAIPITIGKFTPLDSKHLTGQARIKIYNIKGQLVKKLSIDSNQFSIKWDGKDENGNQLSTGIYLYQLKAGNYKSEIKKMILIK